MEMENIPTLEPEPAGRVTTEWGKSAKRLKKTHRFSKLPRVVWIHHNPRKTRITAQYQLSTLTPPTRTGLMLAFNVYWIQPTQIKKNMEQISSEYYVKGGKDDASFYIKQLNEPTADAVAMVLAQGATVYVSMLKGFHEVFDAFNKGQGEKVLPNKARSSQGLSS